MSRTRSYVWINASIAPQFKAKVDALARSLDRSTAWVVRSALEAYLAQHPGVRRDARRPAPKLLDFDPPAPKRKAGRR